MILLDPTAVEVRPSPIHGLGLFATRSILKGTPVTGWRAEKDFRLSPNQWDGLPVNLRRFLYVYCWRGPDDFWYGTHDNARFTNHAKTPNIEWDEATKWSIALRDIAAGEEITESYEAFDGAFNEYKDEVESA